MPKDSFFSEKTESFLQEMWQKRAEGLPGYDFDWTQTVTDEDVLYLLQRYPYLQLLNTQADFSNILPPTFINADSGWIIHDYGDAMSTSPGEKLFGPGNPELKDEEGEGGHGTVINQAFDTAQQMVLLAYEKGWSGIQMVSGTHLMRWSAWIAAADLEMNVIGFEPTTEDEIKRKRLKRELDTVGVKLKSGMRFGRR